ncbi:MAG: site-2 protease family protein [Meiothermus sp.]|uniref:site-2 protease family protein n=1 Tax=Meiothermus sp. TaxID=1955249 RepID=UPI0025D99972|nr:site-2 protease family protein [Meiothermus sp.]MCS7058294.1 site-2 protease family protein [Meiothermus sp.]MCS7194793.1 site-2 protease family protein [Meiothermus sp.]MCX7739925.1 site-2 protease family protein [Meiothermus sp.]MDW8090325.1 site-2 protease family protein [Meiothermus sp.]MDW8481175.1 site-2 protease family protein [Meiothermus sp.]
MLFFELLGRDPLAYLVAFAAGAFGLVVHNLFQAYLADRYRDSEPRRYGFLTLEPRVHLDALGLLFLALLGFGFPRLVPWRLFGPKGAQVALMGPLGFFAAAFLYILLGRVLEPLGPATSSLAQGLQTAGSLMVGHAAVFLFPVPPLDGARVVYAVGSPEARRFMDQLQSYGFVGFFVIFLVLNLTGILPAVRAGLSGLLNGLFSAMGL